VTCLWVWRDGRETLLADPTELADDGPGEQDLPDAERARRERMREVAEGITAYSVDRTVTRIAFAVGGVPYIADVVDGTITAIAAPGPVVDPRIDPDPRDDEVGAVTDPEVHDGGAQEPDEQHHLPCWTSRRSGAVRASVP